MKPAVLLLSSCLLVPSLAAAQADAALAQPAEAQSATIAPERDGSHGARAAIVPAAAAMAAAGLAVARGGVASASPLTANGPRLFGTAQLQPTDRHGFQLGSFSGPAAAPTIAVAPEPETWVLLGTGLLLIVPFVARRRTRGATR